MILKSTWQFKISNNSPGHKKAYKINSYYSPRYHHFDFHDLLHRKELSFTSIKSYVIAELFL